ncbi:DNA-3-methyladenine glycosylase I [Nesterenkonia ebinurensis]|uniref:DNA-3-methyladenine glycosylase I n=1 Tax=Nesterenkonia ebinurensis TaxID=2608252 RepID=UPI001CC4C384|nr:DNA-3-methyladenine glycosylase I [Nesterenkonia ebinurensis]
MTPTTVFAFMQAMGLISDHIQDCTVRAAVEDADGGFTQPSRSTSKHPPTANRLSEGYESFSP